MKHNTNDIIARAWKQMRERGIDYYIVPSEDPHQSEYVSPHWHCRKYLTGFTGSAGTALLTRDACHLWVDGRYYIQADEQTAGTNVRVHKIGLDETDNCVEWLAKYAQPGTVAAFDGRVLSQRAFEAMQEALYGRGIKFRTDTDIIGLIWEDRPPEECRACLNYPLEYAGKSSAEKLEDIRAYLRSVSATHYILTALDEIAWVFNIRGSDIPNNPVVLAYGLVSLTEAALFLKTGDVEEACAGQLAGNGVRIEAYGEFPAHLSDIKDGSTVVYDADKTNVALVSRLGAGVRRLEKKNVVAAMKAVKNDVEIENMRMAHIEDGAAMVKFLHWLDTNVGELEITEASAVEKLLEFRQENEHFEGLSFDTIAGYREHAALAHHMPDPLSSYPLEREGFFLVDSGGQYKRGTIDLTRTVSLGKLSREQRFHYTLVLKAFIALARLRFAAGCSAGSLDAIPRQVMWENGLNYHTATGHGVGCYLNVHEGPQLVMYNGEFPELLDGINTVLKVGMNVTNEPGIYLEGRYGIRIEDLLFVQKDIEANGEQFLSFEDVTVCPIDMRPVLTGLLTDDEKAWINEYHRGVYEKLKTHLTGDVLSWLREATAPVE